LGGRARSKHYNKISNPNIKNTRANFKGVFYDPYLNYICAIYSSMNRVFLLVILLFTFIYGKAQKETSNWFFGDSVFLHFTGNDIISGNGTFTSVEGCASISTKDGKPLFWGAPEKTYSFTNKIYKTIGNNSSLQGIIYLKHPDNDSFIFSFTSDEVSPYFNSKLAFHIYKTNGDSFSLNKILWNSTTEKLHACNHQNNKDIWIATHDSKSDSFIIYLLKREGLICCPVFQKVGFNFFSGDYPKYNGGGQMKFSPNGNYLVSGIVGADKIEIFLFKSENGEIQRNSKISIAMDTPYGLEYSSDSKSLLISANKGFHQFSLTNYTQQGILDSHKLIFIHKKFTPDQLQLALDSKIYAANWDSSFLSTITNTAEDTFKFQEKAVNLKPKISLKGLPNFNASYFYTPSIDYSYEQNCRTNTVTFEGRDTFNATNHKWIFSKGAISVTRTSKNPSYTFSDTGKWQVKYIVGHGTQSDTVIKTITIRPKLEARFLGEDINYCEISPLPLTLHSPKNLHCIHWYNDTMDELARVDSLTISKEGTYYAKATNLSFCIEWDTIKISKTLPAKNLKITKSLMIISSADDHLRYQWFRDNLKISDTTKTIPLTKNGTYKMYAYTKYGCWVYSNEIIISDVAIEHLKLENFVIVYPNPGKGKINIDISKAGMYAVKLYSIDGKLLYEKIVKGLETETLTHKLPKGEYVLIILNNEGNSFNKKILVE